MDSFYFYNLDTKTWCANWLINRQAFAWDCPTEYLPIDLNVEQKLQKAMQNPSKNLDFIVLDNSKIFPGIPADYLFIPIDAPEIRFVGKDFFYCAGPGTRYGGSYGRTCIPIAYVQNPIILKTIQTQYDYIVDYIDKMQRDERPIRKEDEAFNYTRAQHCYESLTDDQKLFYMINGDAKYLFK